MIFAPDYYLQFRCIADRCRHSCCVGWEIDIDADTRVRYAALEGDFARRLAEAIEDGEETASFRLTADERCPMLRADGLCELILTLGEDALCQICTDHPRFRNFLGGRTEIGLGLCCEAAGALILSAEQPMTIIPLEDDGDDTPLSPEEEALLAYRDALLAIAGNDEAPPVSRMEQITAQGGVGLPEYPMSEWQSIYRALERLEPAWDEMLDLLGDETPALPASWARALSRLLAYFLYRHLPDALTDGRLGARTAFCVLSTQIVGAIFAAGEKSIERLTEIARLYSAEIEYNEDNVERLLELLEK